MNTISQSIRRRFSSNASTITEPSSPGADARGPTFGNNEPTRYGFTTTSPLIALNVDSSRPKSYRSRATSVTSSTYILAPEYQVAEDDSYEYHPFPTMAELCHELGLFYPLERQPDAYIDRVGGYTGPITYAPPVTTEVRELRERSIRKVTRRVSVVGRRARKLSGELGRRASRLLGLNTVPDLTRRKERTAMDMDDDIEWSLTTPNDMEKEVAGEEVEQRSTSEVEFQAVEWQA